MWLSTCNESNTNQTTLIMYYEQSIFHNVIISLAITTHLRLYTCVGGIDDMIGQILCLAHEQELPIIFAMSRRKLAFVMKKSQKKVACVGIFRHEGAEVWSHVYIACYSNLYNIHVIYNNNTLCVIMQVKLNWL